MTAFWKKMAPVFLLLLAFCLVEGGIAADYADARSSSGGRSFSSRPSSGSYRSTQPSQGYQSDNRSGGSFGRGLAGGLVGGALGSMLFGGMFGGGGSGTGILPLLILGGIGYYLYKRYTGSSQRRNDPYSRQSYQPGDGYGGGFANSAQPPPPPPPVIGGNLVEEGLEQIRQTDPHFDPAHFKEVASDVFFQVQAGWMRRDLDSYRHLLGEQLAGEYALKFEEMRKNGQINKLESIAVRTIEIVQAGSDGREDFVTVLFTANLLDYTVDDKSGALISGSMTNPVKFQEEWTWARPVRTDSWKLEGIKVV